VAVVGLLLVNGCSDTSDPQAADTASDVAPDTSPDTPAPTDASDVGVADGGDAGPEPEGDPAWPGGAVLHAIPSGPTSVRLEWTPAEDDSKITVYEIFVDGAQIDRTHGRTNTHRVGELHPLEEYTFEVAARDDENNLTDERLSTSFKLDIPEPAEVAPTLDPSLPSTPYERHRHLFDGDDPLQRDVEPGSIEERRIARITGRVVDVDGDPLSGVHMSIHRNPQWGHTLTRPNGEFDFAVNGGGQLTVVYKRDGYLPAYRETKAGWQSSARIDDVILLEASADTTLVEPSQTSAARGEVIDGPRGERQATLIFRAGTSAQMVMPDGSTQPLDEFDVGIVEYTVGDDGSQRMPADLPPTTGYTYAAEIVVEEARAAGAKRVEFDQPVAYYLDNFLGASVGEGIPLGVFDPDRAVWVPEGMGRVIEILGVDGQGRAQVDVDGDGQPADPDALAALDFADDELEKLAELYSPGDTLWRTLNNHFSTWDCNWGIGCDKNEGDCEAPDKVVVKKNKSCDNEPGSTIECQTQSLRESIPLVGVPFDLHYSTRFQFGYAAKRHGRIRAFEDLAPRGLLESRATVTAAGTRIPVLKNSDAIFEYVWDGLDREGRRIYGSVQSRLQLSFCYSATYQQGNFASIPSGTPVTVSAGTPSFCLGSRFSGHRLDGWSLPTAQLGGWTLGVHHSLGLQNERLYRGDGVVRQLDDFGLVIKTVAGTTDSSAPLEDTGVDATETRLRDVESLAISSDGSLYFISNNYVFRRKPDGRLSRVAGEWADTWGGGTGRGFRGDGGPARHAQFHGPSDLAFGPDGSLYIADRYNDRIRKIVSEGRPIDGTERIVTVAGGGTMSAGEDIPDGTLATDVELSQPQGIDIGPDGSIFIADSFHHRVHQVTPNGHIETIAGTTSGFSGDGGPSRDAQLHTPIDVEFGANGDVYVLDRSNGRVRRIAGGIIDTVAGNGARSGPRGDGEATEIRLHQLRSITLSDDGSLFIGQYDRIHRVRGGLAKLLAGGGALELSGDGVLAAEARLSGVNGLAASPDGQLYYADGGAKLIRVLGDSFGSAAGGDRRLPSADGSQVFVFDHRGRHLETLEARSGERIYEFVYRADGLLDEVVDQLGRTTRIERDSDGLPTAVVGPFGHRTELELFDRDTKGRQGYLAAVSDPEGHRHELDYHQYGDGSPNACPDSAEQTDDCCLDDGSNCEGLLSSFVEPTGAIHTYRYDHLGRLVEDTGPEGFSKSLARLEGSETIDYTVDITTARGATTSYSVEHLDDERTRYTKTLPTDEAIEREVGDDTTHATLPDGTTVSAELSPDPRFEMHAPYARRVVTQTPSGLTSVAEREITVALTDDEEMMSLERHEVASTINGRTFESVWEADASGGYKTVTSTDPLGRTQTTTLDHLDRPVLVEVPGLAATHYVYEDVDPANGRFGRLLQTIQGDPSSPDARRWDYSYIDDPSDPGYGMLEAVTSPLVDSQSGQRDHQVSYGYDAALRTVQKSFADQSSVEFGWDESSNMTSLTPPDRSAHEFDYDSADRTDAYRPPAATTGEAADAYQTDFAHNEDHLPERVDFADGTYVDFTYEPQTLRLDTASTATTTYDYLWDSQTGQLNGVDMVEGQTLVQGLSYAWDGPLIEQATWSGEISGSVDRTYDDDFRVRSRSVNGGHTVNFDFFDDDRLQRAGDLTLDYFATHGLLEEVTLGDLEARYSYNQFGEPSNYVVEDIADGTTLFEVDYLYDELGRIESLSETTDGSTRTFEYGYDRRGRLVEVTERDLQTGTLYTLESYAYDANGNRTVVDNDFGALGPSDIDVDEQDRLTRYGDLAFNYTAAGRLQTKTDTSSGDTTTYDYDEFGNLRQVDLPDGTSIEYPVDGQHRRIGRRVYDDQGQLVDERYWLYKDALNPIAELNGNGEVTKRFVYGSRPHVPDYMVRIDPRTGAETTYRIVSDHLGSVRLVVDTDTGDIAQRMSYDAWGNVLEDTDEGFQPFGYAGGLYDGRTGLVRFGARDYDPWVGRWTNKDPIGFDGGDANLYGYVGNDPVNLLDPAGEAWLPYLQTISDFSAGFGDTISFGLTRRAREAMDTDDVVNRCGGAYSAGKWAGVAHGFLAGGTGVARVAGWRVLFLRYKGLRGGGINFYKGAVSNKARKFAVEWHTFWHKGKGKNVWRPHYHRKIVDKATGKTKHGGSMKKHRPWDGGW
jgi:RHS repeat-associated protein